MRCAECGQETADVSQSCALCGAPVSRQRSVRERRTLGYPGDATATRQPVPLPDQQIIQDTWSGKRASGHRRGVLVMVGTVVVALVGAIAIGAIASSPRSSRSLASSASPVRQLTEDQLQPGDCLRGSNMGLGTGSTWPYYVTAVPCTQRHIAEVFFAGNAWPQSLAYPGDNTVGNQAYDRCANVLPTYVGSIKYLGVFSFDDIAPDRTTWPSGDRLVVCVAYRYDLQSVNYSIKKR
jgi:Septum formation